MYEREESIEELAADLLREDGEKDVLEFLSDGEGDDLDTLEAPIQLDESFPNTIVIGNLPTVGKEKYQRLMGVLGKVIDKYGDNTKDMPMSEATEKTYGFVIVTFDQQESAGKALQLDGMNLDKAHTFKVVRASEFDEIVNRSDNFMPKRTLSSFPRADFRDWLGDKRCREQILLRFQQQTEIHWHDTMAGMPVLCYGGEREKASGKVWCDWRVHWSPQGSYLATFHQPGIALWAGPEFEKKVRLPHHNVREIDFSPNEEFVLMWNGSQAQDNDDNAIRIYHVLTGQCVRTCRTPPVTPNKAQDFPHFLWSSDGKFIAECTESRILVRDTDTFEIIKDAENKRSPLKFDSLETFQWSPKGNVIAAWTLEKDNNPARLVLVEIPSRKELASRSRTQCEAVMHWQSEGDYLCLQVTKLSKTKKRISTNMEILRIREKRIPVDVVTVEDTVRGFFWETKGRRFAVLTADEAGVKPKLLIYRLGEEKCEQLCCFDLPSNSFNQVIWAPEGQYFVVASVASAGGASSSGDLLFAGLTENNKLEILHKDEHYMLTDVNWDPSSRYVITAVTQPMQNDQGGYKYSMEAGYAIWTFQGRNLYRQQKEKLYQVAWRPHPPSLLPDSRQQHIRKNIKQFSKKYDALDEQAKESARAAFRREREDKTNAFRKVLERLQDWKENKMEETGWGEALDDFTAEQGWAEDEQIIEEQLDVNEEYIHG